MRSSRLRVAPVAKVMESSAVSFCLRVIIVFRYIIYVIIILYS
jgi:hypothetical protein